MRSDRRLSQPTMARVVLNTGMMMLTLVLLSAVILCGDSCAGTLSGAPESGLSSGQGFLTYDSGADSVPRIPPSRFFAFPFDQATPEMVAVVAALYPAVRDREYWSRMNDKIFLPVYGGDKFSASVRKLHPALPGTCKTGCKVCGICVVY